MLTSRIAIILIAVLAFAGVSLTALWGWSEKTRYADLYATETVAREAAEGRLSTVQSSLRRVESNYATSELRLRQVLATVPDRGTPAAVYNELCARANCAKPSPMPAPAD